MAKVEIVTNCSSGKKFSAKTFLDYLKKSNDHWWVGTERHDNCPWVFRGHRDSRWPLIPSAARTLAPLLDTEHPNKLLPLVAKLRSEAEKQLPWWKDASDGYRDQFLLVKAHAIAIRNFVLLARDLEYSIEKIPEPITLTSYDFTVTSGGGAAINTKGNLYPVDLLRRFCYLDLEKGDVAALAQHHGIPTFLLDWTDNPIVASYFALGSQQSRTNESDCCVWALDTRISETSKVKTVRPLKSGNRYLASQAGLMTYLSGVGAQWEEDNQYPRLDEVIGQMDNQLSEEYSVLQKIVLPKSEISAFRELLRREGVSKAHLMPTLDNIAEMTTQSF